MIFERVPFLRSLFVELDSFLSDKFPRKALIEKGLKNCVYFISFQKCVVVLGEARTVDEIRARLARYTPPISNSRLPRVLP